MKIIKYNNKRKRSSSTIFRKPKPAKLRQKKRKK